MIKKLESYIRQNTDKYFTHTKEIVKKHGDKQVVYAVFLRKPALYACKLALDFIFDVNKQLNYKIKIIENFQEGDIVAPGEPLFFIQGNFANISELETLFLQKVGIPCTCAWNTYHMALAFPKAKFISMLARHCVNPDMTYACEYGASVGSARAQKEGCLGFIGSSNDFSASLFGQKEGLGTMPHSLIGYAGSTLNAVKMFYDTFHPEQITALVDYFGKEVTDSLAVCKAFPEFANNGKLIVRLDTHGARYMEGLNYDKSYDVIEKYAKKSLLNYKHKEDLHSLVGQGVSAAAIFYLREKLDEAGFFKVKITVSSGFNLHKCMILSQLKPPIDIIGTGSYIPTIWSDTNATSDIVEYDGISSIKKGREYLVKRWLKKKQKLC